MKLLKITSQHRRDFTGTFECEGCKHTEVKGGYDDRRFHDEVIPKMVCKNCGKSSVDLGSEPQFVQTKYPAGYQV